MRRVLQNKKTLYKIITLLIPVFILLLFVLRSYLLELLHRLPVCPFYKRFDLYCPGCGNTRSLIAFLNWDLCSSLRFNIEPILVLILLLGVYVEFASYSFGHHIRILPRSGKFYIVLALLLVLYFIVRNFFPYLTP